MKAHNKCLAIDHPEIPWIIQEGAMFTKYFCVILMDQGD